MRLIFLQTVAMKNIFFSLNKIYGACIIYSVRISGEGRDFFDEVLVYVYI